MLDSDDQLGRYPPAIILFEQAIKASVAKSENYATSCNVSLYSLQNS